MSSWSKTEYKTSNWPAYNAALKQRGSLSIWFDPNMIWQPEPTGKRGRTPRFSDAAIQACLTLKVLFNLPLRQTTGFVESLLNLLQLDWAVPDYSTLSRRAKTLTVQLPYRSSAEPLTLLIDSTGIKVKGEGEWQARKHGVSSCRQWRKLHIGIDADTLEIRAVEVTSSQVGDSPIKSVTRRCCPICSINCLNPNPWSVSLLMARTTHVNATRRLQSVARLR